MNTFDAYYEKPGFAFGETPSEEIRDFLNAADFTGHALDLGAGDGRNAMFMARHGLTVTAVDNSKVGLEKLRRFADQANLNGQLKTVVADVREYPLKPGSFDLIAAVTILDHLQPNDAHRLFDRITAALRPGGVLYVKSHTIDDPGFTKSGEKQSELWREIHNYFERNQLLRWAMPGYYVIRYEETREEDTSHGEPHYHGFAKMLARKLPFDRNLLPLNRR